MKSITTYQIINSRNLNYLEHMEWLRCILASFYQEFSEAELAFEAVINHHCQHNISFPEWKFYKNNKAHCYMIGISWNFYFLRK